MRFDKGTITLNQLRFYARHGVMTQERRVGGEFIVSLSVQTDFSKALLTDDVDDTVNYATLLQIVRQEMEIPSKLLEHLAGRIAKKVCDTFDEVEEVCVEIEKVNPPLQAACKSACVKLRVINDKT